MIVLIYIVIIELKIFFLFIKFGYCSGFVMVMYWLIVMVVCVKIEVEV